MIKIYMGVPIYKTYSAKLDSGEELKSSTLSSIKRSIKDKSPKKATRKEIDKVMAALGLTKVTVNGKVFYE